MKHRKNLAAIAAALSLFGAAHVFAQTGETSSGTSKFDPRDILGAWDIVAGSYAGKNYTGTVDIRQGAGAYTVRWHVGDMEYTGLGLRLGQYLGVGWGNEGPAGVVIYQIVSDSLLKGYWAFSADANPVGSETAHGGHISRKDAMFTVEGVNPNDGSPYTGSLQLKRNGDAFDVIWKVADDTYYGTGIQMGGILVVGWGASPDGLGAVLYKLDGNNAYGKWTLPGDATIGVENLARHTDNGAGPGR